MSNLPQDNEFLDRIRAALNGGTDNLDEQTVARLRRIRLDAVESAGQRRRLFGIPRWVTASGFATVAVVATATSVWFTSVRQSVPLHNLEDVEVLAAQENLEISRDLDFYLWLAETPSKERQKDDE